MDIKKPLEGIRVVELGSFVAGPTAGRLLAEWGAEVIRVESFSGDPWRFFGVNHCCPADEVANPAFDLYNANKKDILINTKTEEGKEVFLKLLETADVFLTSNRYKSLVKSGLDYDSLKERCPRLIYALLTGYGMKGDDADQPGYDGVSFFARSGILADSVNPNGYPMNPLGCFGDCVSGTTLYGAICAALLGRERTGKGDMVEVSLFGAATWLCARLIVSAQEGYGEEFPKRREIMDPLYNFYATKDKEWIMLTIMDGERYFRPLCKALEIPEVADDPRFASTVLLNTNRGELIPILEAAFAKVDSEEIMKRLLAEDIVFDRLRHFKEVSKDPQAIANQYVRELTYPDGHKSMMVMPPIRSVNIGDMPYSRAPFMGEHTDEIMKGIGYSDADIARIKEAGAVKQHD